MPSAADREALETAAQVERRGVLLDRAVLAAACLAAALSLIAIAGWILDVQLLRTFDRGAASTKFNTALGILAVAIALLLLAARDSRPRLRQALAGLAVLIGALTLVEYVFGVNLGIDELVFDDPDSAGTVEPGRPAPNTAAAMLLLGLALLRPDPGRLRLGSDLLGLTVGGLALVVIGGYVTGTTSYRTISDLTEMAIPTASAFAVLGFGTALVPAGAGLGSLVCAPGSAGRMVRGLLPLAFAGPAVIAGVLAALQEGGLFDERVRLLLLVIVLTATLVAAVVLTAGAIRRRDRARNLLIGELELRARQLEEANTDLNRSNRELEQFASIASHDLREPLLVIEGFSGLLQRRSGDQLDAEGQRFLENIGLGVERMQRMIDGLLDYSRAGRRAEEMREFSAREVVLEALDQLASTIEERQAEIEVGEMPTIRAGRVGLTQVFQNLIGNGLKFSGEAVPRIEIEARRDGDEWEFSVADNGVGIDPERTEEVFEMFRRLHPASIPGAGIGLATCRRIIDVHGGRIWAEPGADGGSVFRFTIPTRLRVPEEGEPAQREAGRNIM